MDAKTRAGIVSEMERIVRRMNAPMSMDDDAESLALALYDPVLSLAKAVHALVADAGTP